MSGAVRLLLSTCCALAVATHSWPLVFCIGWCLRGHDGDSTKPTRHGQVNSSDSSSREREGQRTRTLQSALGLNSTAERSDKLEQRRDSASFTPAQRAMANRGGGGGGRGDGGSQYDSDDDRREPPSARRDQRSAHRGSSVCTLGTQPSERARTTQSIAPADQQRTRDSSDTLRGRRTSITTNEGRPDANQRRLTLML